MVTLPADHTFDGCTIVDNDDLASPQSGIPRHELGTIRVVIYRADESRESSPCDEEENGTSLLSDFAVTERELKGRALTFDVRLACNGIVVSICTDTCRSAYSEQIDKDSLDNAVFDSPTYYQETGRGLATFEFCYRSHGQWNRV